MNLQALYDLKERLEHAAIAGTALLHEDFRLRRAIDAVAPLAKANPVFAKISAGAAALLDAPEQERAARLLDVLSLVDAVVYTQGTSNLGGTMTVPEPGFGTYVEVSYGELHPLLTALSGSGTGRTSLIREYWESHSEYFSDFRVLPYVVEALGDNYGELADLASEILQQQGSGIIPLLKDNFDPAGKNEMARRVQLIVHLAGARENEWFRSILPDSTKAVREAVIQVLGLSQDNAQLLLDLCQSERGKLKEAAIRALAAMDEAACIEFLQREVEKKPTTVWCLTGVNTPWAADLTAFATKNFLMSLLEKPDSYDYTKQEKLMQYVGTLSGKYSGSIHALWIWIADHMNTFSQIITPTKKESVGEMLRHCFISCMLSDACPEMLTVARELGEKQPDWFMCARFLSDMICCSPEDIYNRYAQLIVHENLLVKENAQQNNQRVQLMMILGLVAWQEKYGGYTLPVIRSNNISGKVQLHYQSINGLDRRWIQRLANHNVVQECRLCTFLPQLLLASGQSTVERILMNLIDPNDKEMCQLCGAYYFRRAKMTGHLAEYLDVLIKCEWTNWQGLMAQCAQKQTQIRYHQVLEQLDRIPMSNLEKANELRQLNELVKGGRVSVLYRIWPEEKIAFLINRLESDPNAGLYEG